MIGCSLDLLFRIEASWRHRWSNFPYFRLVVKLGEGQIPRPFSSYQQQSGGAASYEEPFMP
jgi:hypothetical protein